MIVLGGGGAARRARHPFVNGGYAPPDIFSDSLVGVSVDDASNEFRRAGAAIGLTTARDVGTMIDVIDDDRAGAPAGRRAVKLDYKHSQDIEFNYAGSACTFGTDWYARGYFDMRQADWAVANGKLEQLLGSGPTLTRLQLVFNFEGPVGTGTTRVGYQIVANDGTETHVALTSTTIAPATRYCFERRAKMNSGFGVADGIYQVWLAEEGSEPALIIDLDDVPYFNANNGNGLGRGLAFGTQVNGSSGTDPRPRYWDSIALSTQRIGP